MNSTNLDKMAAYCAGSYLFGASGTPIDWGKILKALLSAIIAGCLPLAHPDKVSFPKKWAALVAKKGVSGCCPQKARRALIDAGVTNETLQDRAFYTAVNAANHDRETFAAALNEARS